MGPYYFAIKVYDLSKSYRPESSIVIDLPAALSFFGNKKTLERIRNLGTAVCEDWNAEFGRGDVSRSIVCCL